MNIDNALRREMKNFPIDDNLCIQAYAIYIYMLLNASYKDETKVRRGQFATSAHSVAKAFGITDKRARTIIDKLIGARLIKKTPMHRYTIYTLLHYDLYFGNSADNDKKSNTDDDGKSAADREYYAFLRQEIQRRELTDDERAFFNNYYED